MPRNPLLDFIDPGNAAGSVPPQDSPWPSIAPTPILHFCGVCGASFATTDLLFEHRFAAHPFRQPTLFLDGREVTVPRQVIVRPLPAPGVAVAHADRVLLDDVTVDLERLRHTLSTTKRGLRSVRLENAGMSIVFELDFDIAEKGELAAVDKLFFQHVGGEPFDVQAIERFVAAAGEWRTATRYFAGLSNYLYGVLAKDQRGGTALPREAFAVKFNMALDSLKDFRTPLAGTIVGLVNFNSNVFDADARLGAAPALRHATDRFAALEQGRSLAPATQAGEGASSAIPLDHATAQILDWALLSHADLFRQREHLRSSTNDPSWTPADRFKARMLLVNACLANGEAASARDLVRGLQHDAVFGMWAQRVLETSG